MTEPLPVITLEKRRYMALIEALRLARYAILKTQRRFDCPPHDPYALALTIELAIANAAKSASEVRP